MAKTIFRNLRQYLQALENVGDVVRVSAEVDPYLELAEIHRRVIAAGGPVLIFDNIKGKDFPVVTNMFGSAKRVELAFGARPMEFIEQVAKLPEELLPPTLGKIWGLKGFAWDALKIGFKKTSDAPVLSHRVKHDDLTRLPALTSWSKDGGPFLTLPLVHTQGGGKKPDNLGMYRVQIFDKDTTGMHFQIGKGGGFHLYEAEQENRPLATNIYLGGPPALILSAIAPLPENVPELMLASLVQGERLGKGFAGGGHIDPIAEAEFCLAGHIPPHVRRPEGPFGDHYGYYSWVHDYPIFKAEKVFHRKDAIFPATVVGKPRQEDFYLGDYLQDLLSPLFPLVMPGVQDLWSYGETGYHALSAAVLRERYGRESMASVFRILGEGQLSLTKFLLAVDKPQNLRDFKSVLSYLLERVDWRKDLFIFPELSMDTLDYSGPEINKGSKGVILGLGEAKRKLPGDLPNDLPSTLIKDCQMFIPGCLVVEIPSYKEDAECVAQVAKLTALKDWPLIVAVDNAKKATQTEASFLWTTFTRFEPLSNIYSAEQTIRHNQLIHHGPVVIDARMKPWYPDELFCDPETKKKVDDRWKEYFPNGKVEMGSSDDGHLYS